MRVPSSPRNVLGALRLATLSLVAIVTTSLSGQTSSPTPLDGFDPNANGVVTQTLLQPDGKIILAGYFTTLQPNGATNAASTPYIARLNSDGTRDTSFNASPDGAVYSAAILSSGKILIGGVFKNVGGTPQVGVARLNADGSLDTSFKAILGGQFGVQVYAVAGQTNGQVVVGGAFNSAGANAAFTRNRLARFNSDGSVDTTFNPNANSTVQAVAIQTDGKIVIGGSFTALAANGASSGTRSYIARLNSDGSLDLSYDPEANASVSTIVLQPNGQALLGGSFTNMTPNGAATSTQVDFFARLNTDGTLDNSFILNPSGKVYGIAIQSDGKLILTGNFQTVQPLNSTGSATTTFIARINTDGSVDANFRPTPNYTTTSAVVQSNGQIILGGYFTSLQANGAPATTARNYIARLNTDGSLDATFAPDSVGRILASAVDSSGNTIIGGTFTSIGGVTRNFLARLDSRGNLDTTFAPVLNGVITAIIVQSDQKIVIGGNFTTVNTTARHYMARLNTDGTLDTAYDPNASSTIFSMLLQSDGKILVGGQFASFNAGNSGTNYAATTTATDVTTLVTRSFIARINTDGTTDTTFYPTMDNSVYAMALQSTGSLIVGGSFTSVFGFGDIYTAPRQYLARIDPKTGRLDETTFNPNANFPVYAIAVQSDDKIVVAGAFTSLTPAELGAAATTIIPTSINRNYIARLNKDGSVDTAFDPEASSTVLSVVVQPSQKIVFGGNFTNLNPKAAGTIFQRNFLARLNTDGTPDTSFTTGTNGQVGSITQIASTNNLLIGGVFTTVTPTNGAAIPASHFARLSVDGAVDTSFSVGAVVAAGGVINTVVLQPDGEVLVGGNYASLGGATSAYLTRFNAAGFADNTFTPNPDGTVNTITVPSAGSATPAASSYAAWLNADGSIKNSFSSSVNGQVNCYALQTVGSQTYLLVGGLFGAGFGGGNSANLVRFAIGGNGALTPDNAFNPGVTGQVLAIAVDSSSRILIGGDFTTVSGNGFTYAARLASDGTTDTTFQPMPNAEVHAILVQSDGNIILGGSFTSLTPTGTTTAVTREDIARVSPTGVVDTGYNPNLNGEVFALSLQSDGKLLVGGAFTSIQPNGLGTASVLGYAARLNSDGTLDASFNPLANNTVFAIGQFKGVDGKAKVILGGLFTSIEPGTTSSPVYTRNELAVVNATDASIDTTWATSANSSVETLAVQPDNKIIVGGNFTTLQAVNDTSPHTRNAIARLNADGTVDSGFDPNANGAVLTVSLNADGTVLIGGLFTQLQPNGALVIGGAFNNIGGVALPKLARISIDGAADTSFAPNPNDTVNAVVTQTDGQLVVGGNFTQIGGAARAFLARLNGTSGAIDAAYAPVLNGAVTSTALQPDGKVIIGGSFTTVNGVAANRIARLTTSGTLDAGFVGNANGPVNAITLTSSGQILVGGSFTSIGGGAIANLARLTTGGTIDGTFTPNVNGAVNAVALAADGSAIIGGTFTSVGGAARANVARVLANGTVDAVYKADTDKAVNTIALQSDGKALFGGTFTTMAGLNRNLFARLTAASAATQTLGVSADGATITWTRGGSSPELASVLFENSTDTSTWTTIGVGTRIPNTPSWTYSGSNVAPAGAATYFVRARGVAPTNQAGSAGLIEDVQSATSGTSSIVNALNIVTALKSAFGLTVVSSNATAASYTATTLPAGLTLNSATGVISGTATQAGVYPVTVSSTTASGTTASTFVITVASTNPTVAPTARIPAVTSQAYLGTADSLKTGFTVSGSGSSSFLLSGAGPALAAYGVSPVITTPKITFSDATGTTIAANAGLGADLATISATADQLGAVPLTAADSALVATAPIGSYSAVVSDQAGLGGVALSQVVNGSASYLTDAAWLSSHTTQAVVYPGAQGTVIVAFNVGGTTPIRLLIRGVGPGLANRGVSGGLADPALSLYDANGTLIAQNSSWTTQTAGSSQVISTSGSDVAYAASQAGAYPLLVTNEDDAIVVTLNPGTYSVQLASKHGNTGTVSAELYQY